MDARSLRRLAAVAVLAGASPLALAEITGSAECRLPGAGLDPMSDRAGILAEYKRLPQACLQEIFRACADASGQAMLDMGSAAVCSFGYEALLHQGFGGNFGALMAWWRSQRASMQ